MNERKQVKIMRSEEAINYLGDKEFLDKLYGYAYKRCSTSHEAEDLCSEILLAILKSIRNEHKIDHFYAFAWTVAHSVYADFSEKRKRQSSHVAAGYSDDVLNIQTDPIDDYIESEAEASKIRRIVHEIAFLSKMYRDVLVMYYLDDMKTADIAKKLHITDNVVKQRLFSARNTIRSCLTSREKEVDNMDNRKLLKPYDLWMPGTGDLRYGDPRDQARRLLSKNILISCRSSEKSTKELAEEFDIPTIFMENELEILCGDLLKKCDHGKYIANFIIADSNIQDDLNAMFDFIEIGLADEISDYLRGKKDAILAIPFISDPKSFEYILWSMIPAFADKVVEKVSSATQDEMREKGIEKEKRNFYIVGLAVPYGEYFNDHFYGQNGTSASNVMGYEKVTIFNHIGERLPWEWNRFGATVSLDFNKELGMAIRASKGIKTIQLTEDEKEIAAKAVKKGYIRKQGDKLVPNIIMFDTKAEKEWHQIFVGAQDITDKYAKEVLNGYIKIIKKAVPKHLAGQASVFVELTACSMRHYLIESCIHNGLLYVPTGESCSEGIWAIIKR